MKIYKNSSLGLGFDNNGGLLRCYFNYWKTCSQSLFHLNFLFSFKRWKKGLHMSPGFKMNLLKAIILLVNLCTSLVFVGDGISAKDLIWDGLVSILLCMSIYLRNFPNDIPKVHFMGLSFIWYFLSSRNTSTRWVKWLSHILVFNEHIIHIDLHTFTYIILEDFIDQSLISGSYVF